MELCDGGCVATLLRNYGPLRWNIVARCILQYVDHFVCVERRKERGEGGRGIGRAEYID